MYPKLDKALSELNIAASFCSTCNNETNHFVLFSKEFADNEDETIAFMTVQCCGCNKVAFRLENREIIRISEVEEGGEDEEFIFADIFPPVLENHIKLVDEYYLPEKIGIIYAEAILAFASGCYLLASAGFRATIESMCDDLNIKGSLDEKINKLEKNQIITSKYAKRLHAIRFLGNGSIHDLEVPDSTQLDIVLEIVEHILYDQYILDNRVEHELTTAINSIDGLKKELDRKIRYKKKKLSGKVDGITLREIMMGDFKRIVVKDLETELVKQINSGQYSKLSLLRTDVSKKNVPIYYTFPKSN